ncbi:MAG: glutathione S-transferase N-terminal domain-containing protein, partial [Asticcacaulis sp.]
MKLFISPASVFVRKVRIVVRERGLLSRVEETATVPVEAAPELLAVNPLSQIPALIDDDGVCWSDSTLICAWLDTKGSGPGLLPDYASDAYWAVRRAETASAGINEMMAKIVYENRRPENERSPFWLDRWQTNLMRAFKQGDALC